MHDESQKTFTQIDTSENKGISMVEFIIFSQD